MIGTETGTDTGTDISNGGPGQTPIEDKEGTRYGSTDPVLWFDGSGYMRIFGHDGLVMLGHLNVESTIRVWDLYFSSQRR